MRRAHAVRRLRSPRLADLLVVAAVAVYLLVVVGATTGLLDGARACPTWPACDGAWVVSPAEPALFAAWAHRVLAVLVGGLVALSAGVAWRRGATRVRTVLAAVAVLYPVQIVLGALTVLDGASPGLSAAHLVVGMGIFSGLLVALLWQLESAEPAQDRRGAPVTDSEAGTPVGSAGGSRSSGGRQSPVGRVLDYVRLTKPKLWWLLCLVAVAAMALAGERGLDPGTVAATLAGGVLAIGASGTFNNVLERDVDRRMARTEDRPLVEGRIPVRRAVAFGLALAAGSVAVFLALVNALAAALGLLAILFYSVVYTLVLKPRTTQNIVIGGAVGAFPALIGWAAVENTVGVPALALGAVIFLWTPAHFYNLALAYREDYARAGIPMLPVVRGEAVTRRHVLAYLGATMVGAVVLGAAASLGWLYAGVATAAGGVFLVAVVGLHRERTERAALRAFHASNAYLGSLLLVVTADAIAL